MANQDESTPLITNEYLDDRVFKFQVFMWNSDNRMAKISRGSIKELVINDNVYEWYHSGYMVISNPKNVLERASKKYIGAEEIDVDPYRFRSDGRDYIYIEMDVPVYDDVNSAESLNNEVYTMKMMMSVYDTQDITGATPDDKQKKIYFWDYRQQLFDERNMWWSTAHAVKRQGEMDTYHSLHMTKDSSRTVYTGDAIKDLITQCLETEKTTPEFEDNFSKGGEKLFYTSPTASRATDDLKYLVEHHVHDSKSAEPCILRLNRYTDKWSLMPISEIFHKATGKDETSGELQLDRFFLADESLPTEVSTNQLRTPKDPHAMNNMFTEANMINDFEFTETSAKESSDFINTTLVHMYDNKNKQFTVNMEQSDIEAVREYMKTNLFDKMISGAGGAHPAVVLNRTKIDNRNVKSQFTMTATQVRNSLEGRNKTMMAGILAGNTIMFNVKGSTSRQSGKFISIDRDSGFTDNDFDDKILGQYFVTSVIHNIGPQGYNNQVIGVKPYLYKDQKFNEIKP